MARKERIKILSQELHSILELHSELHLLRVNIVIHLDEFKLWSICKGVFLFYGLVGSEQGVCCGRLSFFFDLPFPSAR